VEHMGRGTTSALDTMLVVAEPASSSLRTCQRVIELARQMGVQHLGVIANKVRRDGDRELVQAAVGDLPVLAVVPYLDDLREPLTDASPGAEQLLALVADALDRLPA